MTEAKSPGSTPKASVYLLDSATGKTIQVWKFENCARIRIGRSEENNIVISDPSVSRFHVELLWEAGAWHVFNIGRNGILVEGKVITKAEIGDRTKFRLGSMGPLLRFDMSQPDFDGLNTITGGSMLPLPAIKIDEAQKAMQVQEIADSDYFQKLQKVSQKLRNQAGKSDAPPAL